MTDPANGSLDFDGQPRTEGGLTDIGADEFLAVSIVSAGAPSGLTATGVRLSGTVNPGHDATAPVFRYGTTPAMTSSMPVASLTPG